MGNDLKECSAPHCVLISHVKERQVYPHINEKLDAILAQADLRKHLLTRISDDRGTPTFELFSLHPEGDEITRNEGR